MSTTKMQPAYSEPYPVICLIYINYTSCRILEGGGRLKFHHQNPKKNGFRQKEKSTQERSETDYLEGDCDAGEGGQPLLNAGRAQCEQKFPHFFPKLRVKSEAQVPTFHTSGQDIGYSQNSLLYSSAGHSELPRKHSPFGHKVQRR